MSYEVVLKPAAQKELERLPQETSGRILNQLQKLRTNPWPSGTQKIQGRSHTWRARVGDYRIVYEVDEHLRIVRVFRIRHRRDAYR